MKSQAVQPRHHRQPHHVACGADGGSDWRRQRGAVGRARRGGRRQRHRHHRDRRRRGDSDQGADRGDHAPAAQPAAVHHRHRDAARRRGGGRRDRAGLPLQHRRSAGDRARKPGAPRQRGRRAPRRSSAKRSTSSARWFRSRGAIPTVVALRERFEAIRRAELERLDFKLSTLPPDARARVDEITRLIVEKLLLTPTEQLKALSDADTVGRVFRSADPAVRPHRRRTATAQGRTVYAQPAAVGGA